MTINTILKCFLKWRLNLLDTIMLMRACYSWTLLPKKLILSFFRSRLRKYARWRWSVLLPEAFLGTTDSAFNSSIISKTIFPLYSFLGSSIKMLIFLKFNYVFLISENIKMADRKPVNNESQRVKVFCDISI